MDVSQIIKQAFDESLRDLGQHPPATLRPDLVLLKSGIDSLGFAILVAKLEQQLGYDPFVLMDQPVYPTTYGEFVSIYEKYQPKQ